MDVRARTILGRFDIDDKIDRWTFEELSTFFLISTKISITKHNVETNDFQSCNFAK